MGVPAVDAETLRTVWKIRQEIPHDVIDAVIFQQACKPGADVMAASQRATLLQLILQMAPKGAFDVFLEEGQPNHALFKHFAEIPLEERGQLSLEKLLPKTK
jgi:hypothetical protein